MVADPEGNVISIARPGLSEDYGIEDAGDEKIEDGGSRKCVLTTERTGELGAPSVPERPRFLSPPAGEREALTEQAEALRRELTESGRS